MKKTILLTLFLILFVCACGEPLSKKNMEACVSNMQKIIDNNDDVNSTYRIAMYKSFNTIDKSQSWRKKYDNNIGGPICEGDYGPITAVVVLADYKIQENFWNSYSFVIYCNQHNEVVLNETNCN